MAAENNKLIAVIMTVVIGVILVGSLLVPVINDRVEDTQVYYNNNTGAFASDDFKNDLAIEIKSNNSADRSMTVNGNPVNLPNGARAAIISDMFTVVTAFESAGGQAVVSYFDESGPINKNTPLINIATHDGIVTVTFTATEEAEPTVLEKKVGWMFYRNETGAYRALDFFTPTQTVYINDINQIYAAGYGGSVRVFYSMNGADAKVYDATGTKELAATIDLTDVMNNVKSFQISADRATGPHITIPDDPDQVLNTQYVVVPAKVIGVTETDVAGNGILVAIPVVVIAAMLVFVIGSMIGKRE